MTIGNIDDNFSNMGRVIAVKFDNILDSLILLTGEI